MPPSSRSVSAEAGFTLLEGLVAIALLAGTMFAIFTLVGGVLNSAHRVGRSNEAAQVTSNALEVMSVINPMLQEAGLVETIASDAGAPRIRLTEHGNAILRGLGVRVTAIRPSKPGNFGGDFGVSGSEWLRSLGIVSN